VGEESGGLTYRCHRSEGSFGIQARGDAVNKGGEGAEMVMVNETEMNRTLVRGMITCI
jgi:hypothetical protein